MNKMILTYIILLFTSINAQNMQWIVSGRMPIAVSGHRAVAMDSVILIIGGYSDSLNSPVDIIQEFNPRTNTWRIINTKLNIKRDFFVINRIGDSLLIFGGVTRSLTPRDFFSMEIYKPHFSPAIPRFNPIFNRRYSESILFNKKLHLFGGKKRFVIGDTTSTYFLTVYNIDKDSVEFVTNIYSLNEVPFQQSLEALGNYAYAFGGVSIGILNHIYRINLSNYQITRLPMNLLQPRAGSCAVKINSNTILIIGGYNEYFKALRSTEKFSITSSTISIEFGANLNIPRRNFAAVVYNNVVYVFGGEDHTGRNTPTVEKLTLTTTVEEEKSLPQEIKLFQNYPNPFNPNTLITFKLAKKTKVSLTIYDILGKTVKTLLNNEMDTGTYSIEWDGKNDFGDNVPSGTYLYQLIAGNVVQTKKMILIR